MYRPRPLTADEAQRVLQELRGFRGYANHRFLRFPRGRRAPAHVGAVTYTEAAGAMPRSNTLCGREHWGKPLPVSGEEPLCRHCERELGKILLAHDRAPVDECAQCGVDTTYELPLGSHQCEE